MVKPDYNRDYYADLELPSSVDVAEIKKQFKKLGMLCYYSHVLLSSTS